MQPFDSDFSPYQPISQPRIAKLPPLQAASIIFVDAGVSELPWSVFGAGPVELIFLSGKDGIGEIACRLGRWPQVSSVHILARLCRGRLVLGSKALGLRELRGRARDLARIGLGVRSGGELLIGAGDPGDGESDHLIHCLADLACIPVRLWRPQTSP